MVKARIICQHISCHADCREQNIEISDEEFEKRKAQARAMHPLDNRPLMIFACKLSGNQLFEITTIDEKIIEAQMGGEKARLKSLKSRLEQKRRDFLREEKQLTEEIATLETALEKNK
jgi:hypothetical protein